MNVLRRPQSLLALYFCLTVISAFSTARAANPGRDAGLRLLQAQISPQASLRRLNCDQLQRAVYGASRAHRSEVVHVLVAALSLDEWDVQRKEEHRLSCVCVVRLFHAAARAVPERTVTLLQTTEALYPECADGLTAALRDMDGKMTVAVASPTGNDDPNDPNGGNATNGGNDPGGDDPGGTGPNGTGPGFPGSPGFGGSTPSGGVALPTPVPIAVTVVVNN